MLSLSILRLRRRYLGFLVFAAVITILVSRFSAASNWEHTKRLGLYSKDGHGQTVKASSPEDKKSSDKADSRIHPVAPPGRQEFPADAIPTVIRWEKQAEQFPVPTESVIKLPTGAPAPIPKIQYAFKDETPDAKSTRQKRLSKVREEFKKSWAGYRENAWMHDELTPTSGDFRDPFCGWAATLVDSLDTLWIMGLEEEFEEAAKAVDNIDFTTSPRQDIPMFETTIRYLGGLLGAYDVSGKKYKNLLSKAEELAEILIGAFDTPNRMPILGYDWKPAFASQPHRASQRSNLAELGSMSLEFTRLAQLTKDPRYYDAVARVTIALAEFQDRTKLPGVFPPSVDASGCNRTAPVVPEVSPAEEPQGYKPSTPKAITEPTKGQIAGWGENRESGISKRGHGELEGTATRPLDPEHEGSGFLHRRASQMNPVSGLPLDLPKAKADIGKTLDGWDCTPQGLTSSDLTGADRFSMGGNQDSTYEYFPKQYLLLGGREDIYHKMYLKTIKAIRKAMIFQPMIPGERDVLFAGSFSTDGMPDTKGSLNGEVEHLTCFIGGMVGMAAQIFDIEGDLDIAKKLADGCVWAYESMTTGIMAESATVMPCENSTRCTWNETAYYKHLDPAGDERDQALEKYIAEKAARDAANIAAVDKSEANRPEPPRPQSHRQFVDQLGLPTGYVSIRSKSYILRPEAIESVWYMYRLTGDVSWQEKGWKMFEAVIKATSTKYGHSAIDDVTSSKPRHMNQMESFWLAETLKYYYLLFSTPETISLDDWVLNTEAHPFKRDA